MPHFTDEQLLEEIRQRFDENKKIIARIGSLMIQLELMNKKLVESEKLKSDFLSNIRNEINNPLAVVLGQAYNLLNLKEYNPELTRTTIETIFSEAFNLNFQFNNIFHAADLEAGEILVNNSKIDMKSFVYNNINLFDNRIREKGLVLDINNDNNNTDEQLFFISDADKLSIIICNLLDNAIKFSSNDGTVIFKYFIENSVLHFYVIDYGIGISQDYHERIFDRFYQIDSGMTKQHKGHGLGLAVTKALIELLNGTIEVNSVEGHGSEFLVTIPESLNPAHQLPDATSGNELMFTEGEIF